MKIGFTGTRNGMTDAQKAAFISTFCGFNVWEFHHGACLGADADAAEAVARLHLEILVVAHPGRPASGAANEFLSEAAMRHSGNWREPTSHFARNRAIVDECDLLIAAPWQSERQPKGTGGGTWYTIQYAEKQRKSVIILWPDGRVERKDTTG